MAQNNNNNNSINHHGGEQLLDRDDNYRKEFEDPSEYEEIDKNKNINQECYQSLNVCCGSCIGFLRAWFPCICFCFDKPFVQVPQSSKCIVERFGKPISIIDPGLHQINTCVDQVKQVSLKTRILDLPQQKITTKDNITLFVDAVIYYRVIGILRAVYRIENLQRALLDQSIASIRSVLGEMTLTEILGGKEDLASRLEAMINGISRKWGTLVEEIFFKDIALNKDTQSDMAATAKQRRLGESKLISNKAEVEAAALLRQTADILDSKAAMQVRYLEVIQNITKTSQDQVLFLPLNTTAGITQGSQGKK